MGAIEKKLARENIDIQSLGRSSYENQRKSGLQPSEHYSAKPVDRPLLKNKK